MSRDLTIDICQTSFEVGNLQSNVKKILQFYNNSSADLVVFSELCLTGYNCKDLFLNKLFLDEAYKALQNICCEIKNRGLLIGMPIEQNGRIFNAAILIQNGKVQYQYNKHLLANYGVFDEKRYFSCGESIASVIQFKNSKIQIFICEDIWGDLELYDHDAKSDVVIVMNASPFSINKLFKRIQIIQNLSRKYFNQYIIYSNCVCAQDSLVFDGGSFVMKNAQMIVAPVQWKERVIQLRTHKQYNPIHYEYKKCGIFNLTIAATEEIYHAIVLGMQEYSKYAKFGKFVIGLSGGIDSALVAVLAVQAFGVENVLCIAMPSIYSSQESLYDAIELTERIGCELQVINIDKIKISFENELRNSIGTLIENEITNENLQPRIRAIILMAIANKESRLLLCTSNKSESAVGYTTLYGDMTGALAPIIDLYKTQVYTLSKWLQVIPQSILNKEPSAELKHNQKDSDSLLPYSVLDRILYSLIEKRESTQNISCEYNIAESEVLKVQRMIKSNEFKRSQSPLGIKINSMMFGTDRRYPICYDNYE